MTGSLLIIAAFMIIPLMVGVLSARQSQETSEDFFVQGRAMGSIAVFFTVAATWWSAFAFLGSNATFYTNGPVFLTALAWNLLFGFMYYWIGKRVWFLGKRFNYLTPSDLIGDFYNSEALRITVAAITLIFTVPYLQIQLTGGAYLIEVASGGLIPFWLAALLFYFIIIIYVWIGGIRAIAWTDVIYGALLFFGMLYAGYYISSQVGGPTALFSQLQQTSPDHLTMPGPNGTMGYPMWFSLFAITAIGAFMGPQIWLRMYSVKHGKLFNLMPFLLGLAAFAYVGSVLSGYSGVLLEPNVENPDQILPIMLMEYAPYLLASLIMAAGASAAMSTANSQIHAVSTVVTMDIYKRYVNREFLIGRLYHGAYRTWRTGHDWYCSTGGHRAVDHSHHRCHHLEKSAPHRCTGGFVGGRCLRAPHDLWPAQRTVWLPCGYLGFIAECCAVCWAQPRAASTRHSGRGTLYPSTL